MAQYENVAVPFKLLGNRQILTHQQLVQEPWIMDFVARFPTCFEYRMDTDILVFWPEGDAPNHNPR